MNVCYNFLKERVYGLVKYNHNNKKMFSSRHIFQLFVINVIIFCCTIDIVRGSSPFEDHPDVCPNIVTRKKWGARTSSGVNYLTIPVQNVIIHHTVSQPCSTEKACANYVRNTQYYHMNELEYWDIGYNFLIGSDGRIYEGVGWHKEGAHTIGYNKKSICIAFIGDFSEDVPANKAIQAAKDLLQCGVELGELDQRYKLYGGRQIISTESPGLILYQEIQEWPHWTQTVQK